MVPCFDGPKGGLSAGEACPQLRPLMSSCALDTSAQRAPNIQLFTSKAQLLLPGPTAQARNRVGGGCMLTPPLPCQSWSPLGFASETSFLSSPAATLQGGSLWFPGVGGFTLASSLGFLPQSHPLLPIPHQTTRVLFPEYK